MAEEDKAPKASDEGSNKGAAGAGTSDAAAKKPDTTPPASGRRSGSTPSVFDTDDTGAFATVSTKPADKVKSTDRDVAMVSTERVPGKGSATTSAAKAPADSAAAKKAASTSAGSEKVASKEKSGDAPAKTEAARDPKPDKPGAPVGKLGEAKVEESKPKQEASRAADAKKEESKSPSTGASKQDSKAPAKKKSFGETTQKSVADDNARNALQKLDTGERQRSTPAPKPEDTGRLQTIPPPAGSAAAAAAAGSKVPPPPGVSARTVPPPERHVPTAAPPGIGRMEEKLNSLSGTLRNYVVASIVLLGCFAVALVVEARTGWLHFSATGQTYGKIYVDQPEVVSRERLVHDRAVQDEWLRALLGTPAQQKGQPATPAATVLAAKPAAGQDEPAPAGSGQAAPPAAPTTPPEVSQEPDPVAEFRDQLEYRNEVRAELIDNLLDEGQSPAENTLYLLKFDSTIVPEERTTAFGVVRADVGSSYGALDEKGGAVSDAGSFDALAKKLLDRPEAELEALGALHALFSKSLELAASRIDGEQARGRGLIQDALRSNTKASDDAPWLGDVKPDATPAEQWSDAVIERLDRDDLYAFADYLGTAPATSDAASGCPEGRDVQVALERVDCVLDKLSSGKGRGKRAAREAKLAEFYAAYYVAGAGASLATSLAPFATLTASSAGISVEPKVLESEGPETAPSGWLAKALTHNLASLYTRPAAPPPAAEEAPEAPVGPETAATEPAAPSTERVLSKHIGFLEFLRHVLGAKAQAFTHTVGQRSGAAGAPSDQNGIAEVLRGAGSKVDAAALRATLSDARRQSRLANAVERNPLVVGFSADLLDPARTETANFGWLLGPALELTAVDAKFTQRPIHNPLSVIVSVPSWWRSMRVNLATLWLTRDGKCVGMDGKEQGCEVLGGIVQGAEPAGKDPKSPSVQGTTSFEVALPGDERGVQSILLPDAGLDRPTVFRDRMQAVNLRAGQPAAIVIPGKNLWKNSTVTLGAQTAEHVSVLPDTSGIIAKFDQVRWPGASDTSVQYRGLPLDVWTSQGRAYAGQVVVYPESLPASE